MEVERTEVRWVRWRRVHISAAETGCGDMRSIEKVSGEAGYGGDDLQERYCYYDINVING